VGFEADGAAMAPEDVEVGVVVGVVPGEVPVLVGVVDVAGAFTLNCVPVTTVTCAPSTT
jgi:heme O synthase-like polyprenyltransferase